jgi:hypothetical protein
VSGKSGGKSVSDLFSRAKTDRTPIFVTDFSVNHRPESQSVRCTLDKGSFQVARNIWAARSMDVSNTGVAGIKTR